jgi:hypothetical protein
MSPSLAEPEAPEKSSFVRRDHATEIEIGLVVRGPRLILLRGAADHDGFHAEGIAQRSRHQEVASRPTAFADRLAE